ncbi:MAG: hypothetical protein GXP58_08265 [Deltaproteobacteria bacterium]|nr:hypothetical protein [Deltaproteobacteria bacterium]
MDPAVKAVLASGYVNELFLEDYQNEGFCGLLTKPYQVTELKELLDRLLSRDPEGLRGAGI